MRQKILFIITTFSGGGGSESLLARIVNHLNPEKYDISVIEILYDDIKVEKLNSNINVLPYIMRADDPKRKEKMYYVFHEPWTVFDEFIGDHYDLYIAFNYMRPIILLPVGRRCISWMHGDIYNLLEERLAEERQLEDDALYKVQRIISVSDHTTQSVIDVHPSHKNKIITIYNGIDIEVTREKSKQHTDIDLKSPSVLFVGRLNENKDPIRLLNVLEIIHKRKPDVYLYFIGWGDPEYEESLKKKIQIKGLQNHAWLLGYQENPFPIMAQADVVCLLSKAEGFPMCLLESVALDKPFVATEIGGARTLSNGQTCGRIIETDQEAADAVIEFMEMDKEKIKYFCRESIVRFDFDRYIAQIENVFDAVLEMKIE